MRGMLSLEKLEVAVESGEIDTVLVGFSDLYGRLAGKRFDAEFFLAEVADQGTHGCDYLLTVDMEMEPVPGYALANWDKGYGDFHLAPDLKTLRLASWLEKTAVVFCDVESAASHAPVAETPRSLLRRQVDKAAEMGYEVCAASELEYYIFEDSYRDAAAGDYHKLRPAGWYIEDYQALQGARVESFVGALRRHLRDSGVPVENSKGEWGLGQHELNIRYADVLAMADRHVIYKQCARELADQQGISVTFMAKFIAERAGSSCHVHISLQRQGQNAFGGTQRLGAVECSEVFRWFLGGWIARAPELMAFYAPTVNSYKRYQSGSWAPTALAWSHDNRTAAFRVVGQGPSLRIECRIPGADCNPYLVYAAALASGLDGISRRTEPPPMFAGDAYGASDVPQVPTTLRQATAVLQQSQFAREAFGNQVVDHYVHFFATEQAAFDTAVTDWERKRYFERI